MVQSNCSASRDRHCRYAEDRFTPSMRQRIDLDDLYAKALRLVRQVTDTDGEAQPLPEACPLTTHEFPSTQLDLAALVTKFKDFQRIK